MKITKKFISLILTALFVLPSMPSFAAASNERVIWEEDFEGTNPLDSYTVTSGDGGAGGAAVSIDSNAIFGSKALHMVGSSSPNGTLKKDISTAWGNTGSGFVTITMDIMSESASVFVNLFPSTKYENYKKGVRDNLGYIMSGYSFCRSDQITNIATLDTNKVNKLAYLFNYKNDGGGNGQALDAIYLNGVKIQTDSDRWYYPYLPNGGIGTISISGRGGVWFDNIKITHYTQKQALASVTASPLNDVNPYNPIKINFNNHLVAASAALEDKDGGSVAAETKLDGKSLVVTPSAALSDGSVYTLKLTGVTDVFGNSINSEYTINTAKRNEIEGTEIAAYALDKVDILIPSDIDVSQMSNIKFTYEDADGMPQNAPIGEIELIESDGDYTLSIPTSDNLRCNTEYTISLKGVSGFEDYDDIVFTTKDGINVSRPVFSGAGYDSSDKDIRLGELSVSVDVDNEKYAGAITTASLMLLYYKGGKLLGVSCDSLDGSLTDSSQSLSASVNITDASDDCYVKAYVVDSVSNMFPISLGTALGR